MAPFSNSVALGPLSLEAHKPLKDNFSYVCLTISSPSVYEAGGCSKTSLSGLGPGQLNQKYCDLGVCPLSPGKDKDAVSSLLLPMCFEVFSLPTEKHVKPTMATKSIISASVSLPEVQMSANLNTQTFLEPMHLVEVS